MDAIDHARLGLHILHRHPAGLQRRLQGRLRPLDPIVIALGISAPAVARLREERVIHQSAFEEVIDLGALHRERVGLLVNRPQLTKRPRHIAPDRLRQIERVLDHVLIGLQLALHEIELRLELIDLKADLLHLQLPDPDQLGIVHQLRHLGGLRERRRSRVAC